MKAETDYLEQIVKEKKIYSGRTHERTKAKLNLAKRDARRIACGKIFFFFKNYDFAPFE